jgi:hypothetical protein
MMVGKTAVSSAQKKVDCSVEMKAARMVGSWAARMVEMKAARMVGSWAARMAVKMAWNWAQMRERPMELEREIRRAPEMEHHSEILREKLKAAMMVGSWVLMKAARMVGSWAQMKAVKMVGSWAQMKAGTKADYSEQMTA